MPESGRNWPYTPVLKPCVVLTLTAFLLFSTSFFFRGLSFLLYFPSSFRKLDNTMSAYGYPVVAGGYPPRPSPYIMSSSPYYPPGPMAYAQPGKFIQPLNCPRFGIKWMISNIL